MIVVKRSIAIAITVLGAGRICRGWFRMHAIPDRVVKFHHAKPLQNGSPIDTTQKLSVLLFLTQGFNVR